MQHNAKWDEMRCSMNAVQSAIRCSEKCNEMWSVMPQCHTRTQCWRRWNISQVVLNVGGGDKLNEGVEWRCHMQWMNVNGLNILYTQCDISPKAGMCWLSGTLMCEDCLRLYPVGVKSKVKVVCLLEVLVQEVWIKALKPVELDLLLELAVSRHDETDTPRPVW